MPANNTGWAVHWMQARFGGLGHLFSPGAQRGPYPHMGYALDNGRFPCWSNGVEWSEEEYMELLEWARDSKAQPSWALVPDYVTDPVKTLSEWSRWASRIKSEFGFPLAIAVQDGMTPADVRALDPAPEVIFVGGSTEWKRATIRLWCSEFDRVHVGRINTKHWLWECHHAGAESVDGTGWFRGCTKQLQSLTAYLRENAIEQPLEVPDWRSLELIETFDWAVA